MMPDDALYAWRNPWFRWSVIALVVSVAGLKPRSEIRAALQQMGFAETTDFVCCA